MSVLTVPIAICISKIITGCQTNSRCKWSNPGDDIIEGTMRSIGAENGNFQIPSGDVRDGFVRITSLMGFDYFIPVMNIVGRMEEMTFVIGD